MNLLNLTTNDYPCSLWQVRRDNPNVSFPAEPSDEDLAPFGYANVHPTPRPSYDQRTERIEEATPEPDAEGVYQQQWEIRPATAEEISAYDLANAPAPDWMGFALELASNPAIAVLFDAVPRPISNGISIGLSEASKGDPRLFLGLWSRLLTSGAITTDLLGAIRALAQQSNLPNDFIISLSPTEEG
jgi:hypothetical protein